MKGVYLIIVFFLTAITSLMSQSESVNISAWIEVVDLPATKQIEIRGMIKNESDQELTLYQKMDLTKSGNAGTAKHQQSGSFTVNPDQTKILGRSSFYKNNTDSYTVIFKIQNDLGTILTDSLFYPERLPSILTKKKEVPTKSIQPSQEKKDNPIVQEKKETIKTIPPKTNTPKEKNTKDKVATTNPPKSKELPEALKKLLPPTKTKTDKTITSSRKSSASVPVDVLEIDGLIIDETRSKIARDFYDLFYKKWVAPVGAKNFSIYIREEPSRGRGAQISLTLNEQKIFQNFVPPRYEALENVVNFAIRTTRARLSARAKINDQLKEEDQMGSGI